MTQYIAALCFSTGETFSCFTVGGHGAKQFIFLFTRAIRIFTVCSCHVMYAFQSESTLHSCQNVKELLTRSRCKISSLSDCNCTRTQSHLVRKQTLNHLAWAFEMGIWLCTSPMCTLSDIVYASVFYAKACSRLYRRHN